MKLYENRLGGIISAGSLFGHRLFFFVHPLALDRDGAARIDGVVPGGDRAVSVRGLSERRVEWRLRHCRLGPTPTTYAVAADSGVTCVAPSATTTTYPVDSGTADAGPCAATCDGTELSFGCSTESAGYTTTISFSASYPGTGTESSETVEPDGGVLSSCAYTLTITQ